MKTNAIVDTDANDKSSSSSRRVVNYRDRSMVEDTDAKLMKEVALEADEKGFVRQGHLRVEGFARELYGRTLAKVLI